MLFRGRDAKTNKWRYGYLTSKDTINDKRVREETIGMQCGIKDINDNMIYENDILKIVDRYYKVKFDTQYGGFRITPIDKKISQCSWPLVPYGEVIGDEEKYVKW